MIRAVIAILLLAFAAPCAAASPVRDGCEPASYYKRFKGGCNNPASWWVNRGDAHIIVTMTREPKCTGWTDTAGECQHGFGGSGSGPHGYVGQHGGRGE